MLYEQKGEENIFISKNHSFFLQVWIIGISYTEIIY